MDPDQILNKTKKELRSLLISAPRGVAVSLLAKDYKMVMGKELPYREMGCRNIEQFIQSIPDTIRVGHGPAGLTCFAVANAETQQIARFVASQKKPALKKSLKPPPVAIRQPTKMSGFTKKSHFGPGSSRPRKFHYSGAGGGGGKYYPPAPANHRPQQQHYIPAGYHVHARPSGGLPTGSGPPPGPGGSNKFGKPFHAKQQQAPVASLPPRMMRSSTSTYEATPSSGSSALLTRPSSAGNLHAKAATSPPVMQVNPSKPGISPIRYPGPQERVQVKRGGSKVTCVYPWKKEFERAESISINQLNKEHLVASKVCTVGYIASWPIKETNSKYGMAIKRLLFSSYQGGGKGFAVLLVFKSSKNMESVSQQEFGDAICYIPEGTKLKVYGESFVHMNKKKNNKKEPGIDVWYYEKIDESQSNSRSHTPSSHGSPSSSRSLTPPSSQPSTAQMSAGDRSALDREIVALLKGKANGIYGRRLGKEYERFFNKPAPPDMMEYTRELPFVKWEEIMPEVLIFSLIESKAPGSDQHPPVKEATRSAVSAPTTPVSSTVKFVTEKPPVPSTVELGGSGDVCDVQVVVIETLLSFYVQRLGEGFSDKFQSMEKSMSAYLSRNAVPPLTPLAEGTLYAMRWNEDEESGEEGGEEIWCRVLIRSIPKQDKAYVLCPDFGNSLLVSMSDLKDLPREFYELPFQAVHCCLHGFRGVDYIDEDKAYEAFDSRALNKSCVAQVMENSGSRVLVELIDSESDGKETINSLLLQELCSEAKLTPVLPEPGAQKVPVTLTDIYMDGIVTVQLVGPGLDQLEHLMTIINEAYEKPRAADFINKVEIGMVCCAVFSQDHKWYRALVKEIEESKKFMVEFVDYGNEEIVEKSKLRKGLDHHLFKLPFQAVKCTLHGLPPSEGQWTDSAIDTLMSYLDCDNMYLQVMDAGDASMGQLPAIKLLIDNAEELEDGGGEILDINDLLLSDPQLFGLGGESSSDLSDVEVAVQPPPETSMTPVTSSTPEAAVGETNGVTSNNGSFGKALDTVSDGVKSMNLSESVQHDKEVIFTKNSIESKAMQQEQEVPLERNVISPIVSVATDASSASERGGALNRSENSTNLHSESPLPLEETISLVVNKDESGAMGVNGNDNSVQLLEVENILTPPSSSESNSMFSPHTPSGSPSHLGGGSAQSPLNSKVVHVDSSSSLASSGPFSPHTPLGSPSVGDASVHFLVGSSGACGGITCANGSTGVVNDINVVKGGLNFESLELKSTVPVIISWAASPNNFIVQLVNNLDTLDSMSNQLSESVKLTDPMSSSLSFDSIQHGLVCCALSSDEIWYRVLVLEPPFASTGDIKVEFLDYGGSESVGVSSLRLLPEKFTHLPFQGISSSLCNISPSLEGQGWSSEALEYFESLHTDKQLFALVVSKDTVKTHVHILDTVSVPGETLNLGQELIAKGFAKMKAP